MIVMAVIVVGVLLLFTVAFAVDELKDIVLVKQFGRVAPENVLQGREGAGLHLKWIYPVEEVVRYDRRMFVLESPNYQLQTHDQQSLLVMVYCFWRIDRSEPVKFYQRNRTDAPVADAEKKLETILQDRLATTIGRRPMSELVNTDPKQMKLEQIEDELLRLVRSRVSGAATGQVPAPATAEGKKADVERGLPEGDFGVEIVAVGIKSLGLPKEVTNTVIEAMKQERQKSVQVFQAEGEARAAGIRKEAESLAQQITDFARRKATDIETEGWVAAAAEYRKFESNPELAMFLRYLDTLRTGLKNKTQIFMDGSNIEAVKWLREGPSEPKGLPLPRSTSGDGGQENE